MDFWQVFPVAVALVLVLEGMLPFVSPALWRRVVVSVAQLDNPAIRRYGLVSMLLGLGLLYLVN